MSRVLRDTGNPDLQVSRDRLADFSAKKMDSRFHGNYGSYSLPHLLPEVPSYRLADQHGLVWPRLPYVVTGRSYHGFIVCFLRAMLNVDERLTGLRRGIQGYAVRS